MLPISSMPPTLAPGRRGSNLSLSLIPLAASVLAAVLGLVALLGWLLRFPLLASFWRDLIPMAPSTAVLFVVYGAAVGLRALGPLSRRGFWLSATVGGLGALVALLLFVAGCLDIHWAVERLGLKITGTVGGAPVGHMSPVTAFCFLLASASFLASLGRSAPPPGRAALALGSASLLLASCLIFLLAYLYGAPLLYGGKFIPPALNTILAFTLLGLALLGLAGLPVGIFGGSPTDGSRAAFAFVLMFIMLAVGVVATGYLYYRSSEQKYRAEIERQLSAIAELKVEGLTQYRREWLGDAAILFQNAPFSALVRRFLEKPEDAEAQRQLQAWLGKYPSDYQYDRAFLFDARGITRMAVPVAPGPVTALVAQRVAEVVRSGQMTLQDFYRDEHDQHVYLALLVPILDEPGTRRLLGVLALRIDPATYLYSFIRKWPTPSRTAETLLVRREGNDALFLNELRFQTNTALNLRISLGNTRIAAVKAALGQTGIVEARDYRGVPVIADVRAIPDSPWFLVSRMDTAEVYAPLRERLWQVVVMIGVLLFGAGTCLGLAWRQQRARFYRRQVELAESLHASEVRYRRLFEAAKDGILILDAETGRIEDVNPFLIELLGCSREAFLTKRVWEVGLFKDIIANQDCFAELQQKGYVRYEDKPLEAAGGRRIEVEFVSNVYEVDRQRVIQCNIRDITERKRAETALQESERKLSEAQQLAQLGRWSWDVRTGSVEWSDEVYRIFHLDPNQFTPCIDSILALSPWPEDHERDQELIRRAMLSHEKGTYDQRFLRPDGSTGYYHSTFQGNYDASGNLISIVGTILDITERKRMEEALRQSEERFRRAVVDAPFPIMLHAENGAVLQVSNSWCEISGYTHQELATLADWTERAYPGRKKPVQADMDALYGLEQRTCDGDCPIRTKSGDTRIWEFSSAPLGRLPDGRRLVVSMAMDVTDRRRLEQERWAMEAQLRQQQKLESIGTLAGGVAHEINNPINGIMNYAQLIQDRLEPNSPLTEYTGEILHETQRVATIVRNLLTFARNEKQSHSPARMVDIIEGTLSLIRTIIRRDQITLRVNVPENLPDLRCRSQQIQQALMNLMTNARDALNERYPGHDPDKVLNVSAHLFEKEGRRWIRVTVEDHGTGITPEVRDRMFDPFFTTKPRDNGTGLGLSITHGIVNEHDGELTVETELGRFTRMHLDLPL